MIRNFLIGFFAVLCAPLVLAQALAAVEPTGSFSMWPTVVLVAIAVGAGLFIWHKKTPAQATTLPTDPIKAFERAISDMQADLSSAIKELHTAVTGLSVRLSSLQALAIKANPAPAPSVPTGPTPEQVAAISAAEKAIAAAQQQLAEAKKAAGVNGGKV
jgi:hypothetical protein